MKIPRKITLEINKMMDEQSSSKRGAARYIALDELKVRLRKL